MLASVCSYIYGTSGTCFAAHLHPKRVQRQWRDDNILLFSFSASFSLSVEQIRSSERIMGIFWRLWFGIRFAVQSLFSWISMSATEIKTVQLFCLGSLACLLATCNSLSLIPQSRTISTPPSRRTTTY